MKGVHFEGFAPIGNNCFTLQADAFSRNLNCSLYYSDWSTKCLLVCRRCHPTGPVLQPRCSIWEMSLHRKEAVGLACSSIRAFEF